MERQNRKLLFYVREALIGNRKQSFSRLQELLRQGADINWSDGSSTALIEAIQGNDERMVDFLLENGADPNRSTLLNIPLHVAIRHGENMVRRLLNAGADPNFQNRFGFNALALAIEQNAPIEIIELLLPYTDVRIRQGNGRTIEQILQERSRLYSLSRVRSPFSKRSNYFDEE